MRPGSSSPGSFSRSRSRGPAALAAAAAAVLVSTLTPAAFAQQQGVLQSGQSVRSSGIPQRDTLRQMMRPITISFNETRLEDVMRFIKDVTQADMEVMWIDDRNTSGMNKEELITADFQGRTALDVLEKVLEKAGRDSFSPGGNTWQLSSTGSLQIGPKDRLNKFKRVEIYSIQDLIMDIPNYNNAPDFDLQSVLQQGEGGGGGQSPFQENEEEVERRTPAERAQELMDLITALVEPEQWVINGGDGATIRYFQKNLIVNGPDYMHRQLVGYPWWPSRATRVGMQNGRRYVTLGVDTATSKIDGFTNAPVTAPGPGGSTGGGGGGPQGPGPGGG